MGRSFLSTRQGVNIIAERWMRLARRQRDTGGSAKNAGEMLVVMAKQRSSECFFGCNDPLEAVIFSALVGLQRDPDPDGGCGAGHVDP